jgi:hypothetical protein
MRADALDASAGATKMSAISFSNCVFEQPTRRRRCRSLFLPAGIMLWVAAVGWVLAALAL